METRYLLDANIVIYIRQKRPEAVLRRFAQLRPGEAAISVIAYGELLYGAMKSSQRESALERLSELSHVLPALPLPEQAAETYGSIRADLEAQGRDDRQQRSLDRRPRPGGGIDSRHQQREGISTSARSEGTELGGVSGCPATPVIQTGRNGRWPRRRFPASVVYNCLSRSTHLFRIQEESP